MTANEVIKAVQNNSPAAGWYIFRYNKRYAWLCLIMEFFYFAVTAGITTLLLGADYFFATNSLRSNSSAGADAQYAAVVIGLLALGLLASIIFQIYDLTGQQKNMIVITDDTIIKSYRGKIRAYPFEKIKNLQFAHHQNGRLVFWMPGYKVNFQLQDSGEYITLAEHFTFGSALEIFNALKSEMV